MKSIMKFFIAFPLMFILVSCERWAEELVKYVVAIGSMKIVKKRISGKAFINFAKKDPKDNYISQDGFLCVTHNPGCNSWIFSSGNSGSDVFFDNQHPLPPGCKIEATYFTQYWPNNICDSGSGNIFGTGSYRAEPRGGGPYVYSVDWNNTCHGNLGEKNISYTVSFIISMPEGTALGEDVFEVEPALTSCKPDNYLDYHPNNCTTAAPCSQSRDTIYTMNLVWNHQEGAVVFSDILPAPFCGGKVVAITNINSFDVYLISDTKKLLLTTGASTTPANINDLYGSINPSLPLEIKIFPVLNFDPVLRKTALIAVRYIYYK